MSLPEKLKNSLTHMFDFYDNYSLGEIVFPLYGKYYARSARYFAVKKAELFAYSNFEHLFYYRVTGQLSQSDFEKLAETLCGNVEALVKPNDEHMSSMLTLIIECDTIADHLSKLISKYKYRKSFKFGFNGWAQLKIMVVVNDENRAIENKAARGDAKRLKLLEQSI